MKVRGVGVSGESLVLEKQRERLGLLLALATREEATYLTGKSKMSRRFDWDV